MLTELLSPALGHPLSTLSLWRLQLEPGETETLTLPPGTEACLYRLTGHIQVDGGPHLSPMVTPLRTRVTDGQPSLVRLASGTTPVPVQCSIPAAPFPMPADCLLVQRHEALQDSRAAPGSLLQHGDATRHEVGEAAYARTVWDVRTPHGWSIACGETLNPPGHWSSWPAHANPNDEARLRNGDVSWEECFFVITGGYGLMHLDGSYHDGTPVQETRLVQNGEALVTPLGAHPIVASPEAWLWYFWAYTGTALQKQYCRWATDVRTYVK